MSRSFETPGALSLYDYDFDSVSRRSSTVVDSEWAADQVRRHELSHRIRVPIDQTATTNAINIQIQVQNNGALAAAEVNNVERVTENTKEAITRGSICRHRNSRIMVFLISSLVIVFIVVTAIWAVYKKMNDNKNILGESTSTQESTRVTSSEQRHSSEPTQTTLQTTTKEPFALVSRSEWGANAKMKGSKRLSLPVKLLIIMDTQTETCDRIADCSTFLQERQKSEYIRDPKFKDIRENFLIASDGTVYEGRGFSHDGQHTYDRQQTDYNPNAIGIAFIGNYTSAPLTTNQEAGISAFIKKSIKLGQISENYFLYHQDQLALMQNLSENIFYKTIQTWDHWSASPPIISKKEWGGLEKKGFSGFLSLIIEKSVALGHSNDSSCSDLLSCSEVMRKFQLEDRDKYSDVRYNFYLGGEDLIFQGRSFDWRGAITGLSLDVLFIGNYMNEQPPQSLINAFESFLQFSVNVGKLAEDYKLYGQRQVIRETDSPGDKLFEVLQNPPFDAHFDFNVTTPSPCIVGCAL